MSVPGGTLMPERVNLGCFEQDYHFLFASLLKNYRQMRLLEITLRPRLVLLRRGFGLRYRERKM